MGATQKNKEKNKYESIYNFPTIVIEINVQSLQI